MSKGSKQRKQSKAARRWRVTRMLFFRKLWRPFFSPQKPVSTSYSLEAHFELRVQILDAPFPPSLTNHIQLLRLIGYQVIVTQLQQHISDDIIGYLSCYREGKLEYREELRIQSIMIEKKTVVFRRIFQSSRPDVQAAACNTNCPYTNYYLKS